MTPTTKALEKVLACTFVLSTKVHGYHWNVSGPLFTPLHSLFGDIYSDLEGAVDKLAEQIRTFDVMVNANIVNFLQLAEIKTDDASMSAETMVINLIDDHQRIISCVHEAINVVKPTGDEGTLTLLADRLLAHGKYLWMLRSTAR
jgi:starvation-inducible DNA-binding protein